MQGSTMSRTVSTNRGSGLSLKESTRWGLRPKARQIRKMADWFIPWACAIERVEQCVASVDAPFKVLTITASTWSSLIDVPGESKGMTGLDCSRNVGFRRW